MIQKTLVIILLFVAGGDYMVRAQSNSQGVPANGILQDTLGNVSSNTFFALQSQLLDSIDNIVYSEFFNLQSDTFGRFTYILGSGSFISGDTSDITELDWGKINRQTTQITISSIVHIDTSILTAVPHAIYAKSSGNSLSNLSSAKDYSENIVANGKLLIWKDSFWIDQFFDSVSFVNSAINSSYTDTVAYSISPNGSNLVDTVSFSYDSDSASVSNISSMSINSNFSNAVDTTFFAHTILNAWHVFGDSLSTNFLGTTDSAQLSFRTNNNERILLNGNGQLTTGSSLASIDLSSDDGFLMTTSLSSGNSIDFSDSLALHFDSDRASIRVGVQNQDSTQPFGNYNFILGNGNLDSANHQLVIGSNNSLRNATYATIIGNNNNISGSYTTIIGSDNNIATTRCVILGFNNHAELSTAVSIGNNVFTKGITSTSIGHTIYNSSDYTTVLGYNLFSHNRDGSFLWGDYTTDTVLNNTLTNSFGIRASGGTSFYTDSNLSVGVFLLPGAGSWSMVSDSTKKKNIIPLSDSTSQFKDIETYSWAYIAEPDSIRHIGPMAQTFNELIMNKKSNYINSSDIDGIILYEIQQLSKEMKEFEKELLLKQPTNNAWLIQENNVHSSNQYSTKNK